MSRQYFFTGALRSPPDERDYKFKSIPGAVSSVVPYHSDVKDIIVNQLSSSQCGACAIIAARYETEYRQNGSTRNLSHTYVYGSDYDYDGEGMYLRTTMKIARGGIPYETPWEVWGNKTKCRNLVKNNTTDELLEEAHKLRGTRYYFCDTWNEVCNAVRATYGAVVILAEVYSNWNYVTGNGIVGKNEGEYLGNHFLRVKDYEILDSGVIKLRCQNSWGRYWGDNGYCYLYSDKNTFMEAACLVDDVNEVVRRLRFNDVDADSYAAEAIKWCDDNGIMTGFEDGTFRPHESLTREQFASVIYRLGKKLGL